MPEPTPSRPLRPRRSIGAATGLSGLSLNGGGLPRSIGAATGLSPLSLNGGNGPRRSIGTATGLSGLGANGGSGMAPRSTRTNGKSIKSDTGLSCDCAGGCTDVKGAPKTTMEGIGLGGCSKGERGLEGGPAGKKIGDCAGLDCGCDGGCGGSKSDTLPMPSAAKSMTGLDAEWKVPPTAAPPAKTLKPSLGSVGLTAPLGPWQPRLPAEPACAAPPLSSSGKTLPPLRQRMVPRNPFHCGSVSLPANTVRPRPGAAPTLKNRVTPRVSPAQAGASCARGQGAAAASALTSRTYNLPALTASWESWAKRVTAAQMRGVKPKGAVMGPQRQSNGKGAMSGLGLPQKSIFGKPPGTPAMVTSQFVKPGGIPPSKTGWPSRWQGSAMPPAGSVQPAWSKGRPSSALDPAVGGKAYAAKTPGNRNRPSLNAFSGTSKPPAAAGVMGALSGAAQSGLATRPASAVTAGLGTLQPFVGSTFLLQMGPPPDQTMHSASLGTGNATKKIVPGGVLIENALATLDSPYRFVERDLLGQIVAVAAAFPTATLHEIWFTAMIARLAMRPEPPTPEPDPDLFRAIVAVTRRGGGGEPLLILEQAMREPLHVEPRLLEYIVFYAQNQLGARLADIWFDAWDVREWSGGEDPWPPTPPDVELLQAIVDEIGGGDDQATLARAHARLDSSTRLGWPRHVEPELLAWIVFAARQMPQEPSDQKVNDAAMALRHFFDPTRSPEPTPDDTLLHHIIAYARTNNPTEPRQILNLALAEILRAALEFRPVNRGCPAEPLPPLTHSFYPVNRNYAEVPQGVTHSATDWYFTAEQSISKIPVSRDLGSSSLKEIKPFRDRYGHYGAPCIAGNVIFVPLEKPVDLRPLYSLFDTDKSPPEPQPVGMGMLNLNLEELAVQPLPELKALGVTSIPWCATYGRTLFTSRNHIAPRPDDDPDTGVLYRYEIVGNGANTRLERRSDLRLWNNDCVSPITIRWLAGGAVSPSGTIYLTTDAEVKEPDGQSRMYAFDLSTGALRGSVKIPFPNEQLKEALEVEGITYWDNPPAPGISGQLHVMIGHNDDLFDEQDDYTLVHFSAGSAASLL